MEDRGGGAGIRQIYEGISEGHLIPQASDPGSRCTRDSSRNKIAPQAKYRRESRRHI